MALPLGKLTILVGAGILGSVIAKEGRLPSVPDFVSSAFKIAFKQSKQQDSISSNRKPLNDSLMAQVNSLREELQMLASNRPITIVTASGTGASKYGTIILVVVVGYGYVWWKGWKLSGMMFATRRSLADACTSIAQQLENVYGSIRTTKRDLSSRIQHVDSTLDEVAALTASTREKVSELLEDSAKYDHNVRNVRQTVETLEMKISRIEGKQDFTIHGVKKLVDYAHNLGDSLLQENAQASSSSPQITLPSKNVLPPPSSEPTSPSISNKSLEVPRPLYNAASARVQQRSNGISGAAEFSNSPGISTGIFTPEAANNGSSSWFRPAYLMRTRSATNAVLHRTSSSRQQS